MKQKIKAESKSCWQLYMYQHYRAYTVKDYSIHQQENVLTQEIFLSLV